MSRDNFISDHLVDMRDQLRDSYDHFHQAKGEKDDPAPAAQYPPAGPEKYLPTLRTDRRAENRDGDRERRDLEGRIIHDLAALDSERELLRGKLAELERFSTVLGQLREHLATDDLGRLRLDYFSARGRWSAFDGRANANPIQVKSADGGRAMLLVAGAIIAGSIVVALVMIGLFA